METVAAPENGPEEPRSAALVEGQWAAQHDVTDDAQRPHIHSAATGSPSQHLRGQVLRCATERPHSPIFTLTALLKVYSAKGRVAISVVGWNILALKWDRRLDVPTGEPKVCYDQARVLSRVVVQQVFGFEVPVDDTQSVEIAQPAGHHLQGLGGVPFSEGSSGDHALQELPSGGQLQDEIDAMWRFEHLSQVDDIAVVHPSQDTELCLTGLVTLTTFDLQKFNGEGLARTPVLCTNHTAEATTTNQSLDVIPRTDINTFSIIIVFV